MTFQRPDRVRAVLAFALCLLAPPLARAADFFFLQMSDPQFGMYANNRNFAQETANFEFAIATANRLRPAFVVVCGDLINKTGDPAQAAEYRRIASQLNPDIPIYNVAGNHDVGNDPTPESLAAYRKRFGQDHYTFHAPDFEGIVLDSSLIQHPEKAPREAQKQERWLEDELRKAKQSAESRIVVFQHIPWFLEKAGEPDQYFNIPLATRQNYLALFARYGVHDVFAGHYHRNAYGETPDLRVTTTGPVGRPLGPDPSGIRVVKVSAAKIESRYYGLGNLPNQIEP
ncbi:MAG: metallophosphoesterase [Bryobacteraceae bacterium]